MVIINSLQTCTFNMTNYEFDSADGIIVTQAIIISNRSVS